MSYTNRSPTSICLSIVLTYYMLHYCIYHMKSVCAEIGRDMDIIVYYIRTDYELHGE